MKEAESEFNKRFSEWDIRLPEDAVKHRRRGEIAEKGWDISYLFGTDERGEFLDYYATHRMTNDRHVRIYADGHSEPLPSFQDYRVLSQDPEENARLKAEYHARNQQVAEILQEKGFNCW